MAVAWDRSWSGAWDDDWDEQIKSFWNVTTVVHDTADTATLCKHVGLDPAAADHLGTQFKVISALLAARKMVRGSPADHGVGRHKCSLLGDLEQMGPVGLSNSQRFWEGVGGRAYRHADDEGHIYLGSRERLCAVSLVKRFCAWDDELSKLLPPEPGGGPVHDWEDGYIPETAEVAASHWWDDTPEDRRQAFAQAYERVRAQCQAPETMWRCLLVDSLTPETVCEDEERPVAEDDLRLLARARAQLLLAAREEGIGTPPRYYAILALDGDYIGRWLSGDNTDRNVSTEFWQDISGKLCSYAQQVEPIVSDAGGYLVYDGGDDVLALFPLETAVQCAGRLRSAFLSLMKDGKPATTVSAGLAIAHYQHDLRAALRAARKAEGVAKEAGRDRLGIVVLKRSGVPLDLVLEWKQVADLLKLQALFAAGLSDRWLHKLADVTADLHPHLPHEALKAVVAHSLKRIDITRADRADLAAELGLPRDTNTDDLKGALRGHVEGKFAWWLERCRGLCALNRFIAFGMIASFLQRGRD